MPILTAGAIALTYKTLEKPLNDLYGTSITSLKVLSKKWKMSGKRDSLVQSINETERTRTIFSATPVPLSSFYYPSKINDHRSSKPARLVENLDQITVDKNILLLGTVGQGKSILMRYLCIQELKQGKKIPIFLELRTLETKDTVQSKLIETLDILGFDDIDQQAFDDLLNHGCFIFFLDGFDELKRELALAVQSELSRLMTKTTNTRWVISSRPGSLSSHISGLPRLHPVSIHPLADDDFDPFLKALNVKTEIREQLVKAIMSSPSEIKGVLKTPLMLTLLNLTFGTSTHIPDTLHEFYESMFLFLVYRHDETKPGYVRQKATQLSNAELQDAFEYFSYLSKDYGVSLSDEDFNICAKNTSKLTTLTFTPDGFRTDLTETICLMQRDGIRTAFIHRSIQEFFTAFFIKHLGAEGTVKSIYERIKGAALTNWQQELRFLEQIDKYRYIEYHRLPAINKFLLDCGFKPNSKIAVTKDSFIKYLASQPILAIAGRSRSHPKRNYFVVVFSGESSFTSFTAELGAILNADGTIKDSIDESRLDLMFGSGNNKNIHKNIAKQLKGGEFTNTLIKFRALVRKTEKEQISLNKILADRKENFRDILLAPISGK
jgi:NACHT domain